MSQSHETTESVSSYMTKLRPSSQKYKILYILDESLKTLRQVKHTDMSKDGEAKRCADILKNMYHKLTSDDLVVVKPNQVKRQAPVSKQSAPKKKIKRKGKTGINPNAWDDKDKLRLAKEVEKLGGKVPGWTKIIVDSDLFSYRSSSSINSMYNQMLRERHPFVKGHL